MNHTRLTRRQVLTGATALGAAAATGIGTARAQPAPAPQKGGQIIVGISQEPQNFNPVMPTIETQRGVHMAIFDDLWRIDPKGGFVPNLALAIPTQANGGISKDGTVFTVKLRPGVKWHDGAPFTARDVVFTWKTIMDPKVTAFSTVGFDQIADMWTGDETTLKFKMKQAYAPIADILADMFIVPEHVLAKSPDINKDEFNTRKPIGTGPFKFVSRAAGDHIALEANRAYHGPGPYLDRLIFKYVPDLTVLFTQLKTGEIDVTGLLCLFDADGACANAVRDSQRTKTRAETRSTLGVVWGCAGFEQRLAIAERWYRALLGTLGATTTDAVVSPTGVVA